MQELQTMEQGNISELFRALDEVNKTLIICRDKQPKFLAFLSFMHHITDKDLTLPLSSQIDTQVETFTKGTQTEVNKKTNTDKPRQKRLKLPEHIITLIKEKNKFRRKWQRRRNKEDLDTMKILRKIIRIEVLIVRIENDAHGDYYRKSEHIPDNKTLHNRIRIQTNH